MASPSTQSSVWGPAASVPAVAVRSAHPEMGEGSRLWPTAASRKYRLGTCPVHCNDCSSPCWAGAALRLVGMSIQEKGCCNWLLHFFQLHWAVCPTPATTLLSKVTYHITETLPFTTVFSITLQNTASAMKHARSLEPLPRLLSQLAWDFQQHQALL